MAQGCSIALRGRVGIGAEMDVDAEASGRELRAVVRQGASLGELGEAVSRVAARIVAHDGLTQFVLHNALVAGFGAHRRRRARRA